MSRFLKATVLLKPPRSVWPLGHGLRARVYELVGAAWDDLLPGPPFPPCIASLVAMSRGRDRSPSAVTDVDVQGRVLGGVEVYHLAVRVHASVVKQGVRPLLVIG